MPKSKRLLEAKLIYFSGSIFGTAATPCFGDWHSVNGSQLATAVYCHQLLLLIEVVASLLHINLLSPSFLPSLINLYKIPVWHKLSFAILPGL